MSDTKAEAGTPAAAPAAAVETPAASETPEVQAPIPAAAAEPETKTPAPAPVAESVPTAPPVVPEPTPTAAAVTTTPEAAGEDKTKAGAEEQTPLAQLWATAKAMDHPEIWGVTLADPKTHIPTQIVLQKYLNANDGDLAKAKDQLTKTLEWRAKTKPLDLVKKHFPKSKFEGLGFVTTYLNDKTEADPSPESKEVFTWNIYGGVKSIDETFGNLELYVLISSSTPPELFKF